MNALTPITAVDTVPLVDTVLVEPLADDDVVITDDAWADPGWHEAAIEYREARGGRASIVSYVREDIRRLRRLIDDSISLDRAWHELNGARNFPLPDTVVEALMFSLRRGAQALIESDTQRRLSALAEDQLEAVCRRAQNFKPGIAQPWSADEIDLLIEVWSKVL